MPKIFVHIGMPKTGSSALQRFLCENPKLQGEGRTLEYIVAHKGQMRSGASLSRRARLYPYGLVPTSASLVSALQEVRALTITGSFDVILSSERWYDSSASLREHIDLFVNTEIIFIAFVRPQIDWFQSAWWQWFAWLEDAPTPEEFWARAGKAGMADWEAMLCRYDDLDLNKNIIVAPYTSNEDIVSQFLEIVGAKDPRTSQQRRQAVNTGLSPLHIRIYQQFPQLRQANRSYLDFYLSRLLPSRKKAPWVVPRFLAARIVEERHEANRKLQKRLSSPLREKMEEDNHWWSADWVPEDVL